MQRAPTASERIPSVPPVRTLHQSPPPAINVPLSHESCFMLDDLPSTVLLQLVHPIEANCSMTSGEVLQVPGMVALNGLHLFLDCVAPMLVMHRLLERGWLFPNLQVQLVFQLLGDRARWGRRPDHVVDRAVAWHYVVVEVEVLTSVRRWRQKRRSCHACAHGWWRRDATCR